jgi:enterochelin esterase-like enzyme
MSGLFVMSGRGVRITMTPTMARKAMFVAGLAVLTAFSAGCSGKAEVGQVTSKSPTSATTTEAAPMTVDKDRLAALAKEKLEQAAGQQAKGVECDGDIEGTVGATQRCTLTAMDGTTIGVTATVLSVKGDDFNVDFKADDHPME